ncbi:MAG: efflux RND transporter periplasmic adaptor subunit [Candidatus Thiodiazotropha weberae]|nr:efflux RND transporter periplasmic adaptor subunit [Candidatus Thiodiazotropha lotti]MCG8012325.1 efflux RND transporter periplasmic adaptor subunit [Candidatus Thiodiazotropha lotti]MCG8020966.1 efflux RND transporter periplasmic adaptor subunit [Candidatus Thiodiazotropha lotti]MCW4208132.1 efflux RND transporter periplasmic adaptor subunit [Candidatus Thiodiazotropha lotti]MCW4211795.1 efflux RND transporter periplasmic adaptor subunit [Candidatus Thiodiazotropha lotti]
MLPPSFRLLSVLFLGLLLTACSQQKPAGKPASDKTNKKSPHLVAIEQISLKSLGLSHQRNGTLKARQSVRIFNQEEGRITALPHYEGDRIEQGEALVGLEDDLLKAELAKAAATSRQMQTNLQRLEKLAKRNAVSDDELVRARTDLNVAKAEQRLLQTRLGYTRITAPFSGVVSQRLAEPGDVVPRHTHLMTLIDPQSLVTRILVSDLLLPQLALNDQVSVRIDGLGSEAYPGKIVRIHPELDENTRMGIVEVALEPVPPGARPGQFCRITINSANQPRLTIPFNALQRDTKGEYVFLLEQDQTTSRRAVTTGVRIAGRLEILSGLKPGEAIVTRGFLGLKTGIKVDPVNN